MSVEATTVNKMCGSGMQAAIMAARGLDGRQLPISWSRSGMESMTNAPTSCRSHVGAPASATIAVIGLDDDGRSGGRLCSPASRWGPSPRTRALLSVHPRGQDEYALCSQPDAARGDHGEALRLRRARSCAVRCTTAQGHGDDRAKTSNPARPGRKGPGPSSPAFAQGRVRSPPTSASISRRRGRASLTRDAWPDAQGLARSWPGSSPLPPTRTAPGLFTTAPVPAIRKAPRRGWMAGRRMSTCSRSTRPSLRSR